MKKNYSSFSTLHSPFSKGFTLIELLLYVAIVTFVMTALVQFTWTIIINSAKNNTQQEVNSSARLISERIKYEIRNATGITSISASTITLTTAIPATSPTIINYSAGNISIKQGTGAVINLNSNNTTIPSFVFTNYSSADNKSEHIGFLFTINANFNSTRQEYQESVIVESSAEVRNN